MELLLDIDPLGNVRWMLYSDLEILSRRFCSGIKINNMAFKVCTRCKKKKNLKEFTIQMGRDDDRTSQCTQCIKERDDERKRLKKEGTIKAFI